MRTGSESEKHGMSHSRLYKVWGNMRKRCTCKTDEHYDRYGKRGITICDEWANSFIAFRDWALSTGYDEFAPTGECTIDRIDNNKGYFPENCRWVNRNVQQNNRRANHLLTIDGKTHTVAEWSEVSGICYQTIQKRLQLGWDSKTAVFDPVRRKRYQCRLLE